MAAESKRRGMVKSGTDRETAADQDVSDQCETLACQGVLIGADTTGLKHLIALREGFLERADSLGP